MRDKPSVKGWNACFAGFSFFLSQPKLWLVPLTTMLFSWTFFFGLFVFIMYWIWPEQGESHLKYSLKVFQSMGISAAISLGFWFLLFSFFLNICFEHLIKKTALSKQDKIQTPPFLNMVFSGFYMFYKTFWYRAFWLIITICFAFSFGPLALFVSQLGIAHIAIIDGCDLSLGIKGVSSKQRVCLIKRHFSSGLMGGIVSGIMSFLFIPTVLVWLFWIPSLYIGAYLWTREWKI